MGLTAKSVQLPVQRVQARPNAQAATSLSFSQKAYADASMRISTTTPRLSRVRAVQGSAFGIRFPEIVY
jgi:hypothetical protein